MYEWIIIGGGIHGCTIGNYLIKNEKTTIENLIIIDPHHEPMEKWRTYTEKIGMEYLRSPSVHHIDVPVFSLQNFKNPTDYTAFYGQYKRPSLQVFNEHCDKVLQQAQLKKCWKQGRVIHVYRDFDKWIVQTDDGQSFITKNLVLSVSVNEKLHIPEWVKESSNDVKHIFSEKLSKLSELTPSIVVVGGGITAAHTVINLCRIFPGEVTLLTRHKLRVHGFDSDPGWLGPKFMKSFSKITDYDLRREQIKLARNRGSMPNDIYQKIRKLEREGSLKVKCDEVVTTSSQDQSNVLHLKSGNSLATKTVLLATGFNTNLPEESWLKALIDTENLSCASCGYPIINQKLEWCPHLFVSGPLAELEIGPVSRNISGARKAAERIVNEFIV
ncbi:lysine N(6)-hydroxylase/L-ornithine N(5)-oxygenase family protein [Metabacillus halosaccharovorans]|uniref:Lysine N(6)-hydroxylase/L-ornithine N(5)-oxygenase family protein n=1 Tax=Metabacillus halosaccharovorans TaxID=930124 RepID=A0ABT3DEM0_9BACI|nr:lysine N(6)-hydroxylase/L-ornithine N(5)-oxygenase family protein [Metabacillus halosaccharovorans]MCV9885502.1 lysine N(6)-hydroxylase/L-ornithine N(5)-oxygenase family protein [Metabacillus halosaccharovorans]